MKNTIMILAAVSLISLPVFADEVAPPAPSSAPVVIKKDHPCRQIEQACKAAGYIKGKAKEGKGLFKNCMKPLKEGKTVEGVNVDPATVQACKEKRAERRHNKD